MAGPGIMSEEQLRYFIRDLHREGYDNIAPGVRGIQALHRSIMERLRHHSALVEELQMEVEAEWIQDDPDDDDAAPPSDRAAPPPDRAPPPPNQGLSVGTQTGNAFYDHTEVLVTLVHQVNAIRQDLVEVRDIVESLQRVIAPPPPL